MVWWYVAVFVVALYVASKNIPKPQNVKPAALEEIEAPTAEEGLEIPVLFGTRLITGPNVIWYGDLRTVAIRKKGGKK